MFYWTSDFVPVCLLRGSAFENESTSAEQLHKTPAGKDVTEGSIGFLNFSMPKRILFPLNYWIGKAHSVSAETVVPAIASGSENEGNSGTRWSGHNLWAPLRIGMVACDWILESNLFSFPFLKFSLSNRPIYGWALDCRSGRKGPMNRLKKKTWADAVAK